jgi:hypothetical protein
MLEASRGPAVVTLEERSDEESWEEHRTSSRLKNSTKKERPVNQTSLFKNHSIGVFNLCLTSMNKASDTRILQLFPLFSQVFVLKGEGASLTHSLMLV